MILDVEAPRIRLIAWAAGLYEGEGTFTCDIRKGLIYPICAIRMNDKEPLVRFGQTVQVGKVNGPHGPYSQGTGSIKHPPTEKPCYRWQTGGWSNCQTIVDLFWDYLSPRRQTQIESIYERARVAEEAS